MDLGGKGVLRLLSACQALMYLNHWVWVGPHGVTAEAGGPGVLLGHCCRALQPPCLSLQETLSAAECRRPPCKP